MNDFLHECERKREELDVALILLPGRDPRLGRDRDLTGGAG